MSRSLRQIDLLPRQLLIKTGPVDEGAWHYHPLLRFVMRQRIALMARLLRGRHVPRLLDLGYGSGILLPELAKYCDELHGIDIHAHGEEVQSRVAGIGVSAVLKQGSAAAMPYETGAFQAVVAMSSLEFMENLDAVLREITRVLSPNGFFIFVTPEETRWGDSVLKWITGMDSQQVFQERRRRVRETVPVYFSEEDVLTYSPVPHLIPAVYRACRVATRDRATQGALVRAS